MERFRVSIFILLLVSPFIYLYPNSDNFPTQSKFSPKFWLDVNYYKGSDDHTQLEIYYSIPADELTFSRTNNDYIASTNLSITVKDSNNIIVLNESRIRKLRVTSIEETADARNGLMDQIVIDLLPGYYNMVVKVMDENSSSESEISSSLIVPSFKSSLDISTVQFASLISSNTNSNTFIKGNKSVIPNPSRLYSYNNSLLYLYYEVYNLTISDLTNKSVFEYSLLIYNQYNDTLIYTPTQSISFSGNSCIQTKTLDIRDLKPGNYWASISVTDLTARISTIKKNNFTIHDPLKVEESLPMTVDDIKRYRDQIKYFATHNQLDLFNKLNNDGKRNFLINFWNSKDTTPETPENEFMMNSFARIDYAEKNFEGGLDSDMGRVFIIYGQPDEIENRMMNLDLKPYIIWDYFSTGTGKHRFVFVDESGNHIYTLAHSTVDTEIHNTDWIEEIKQ